jgi:hypothetical protein
VIGTASEANHAYLRELGATPTTYGPGRAGPRACARGRRRRRRDRLRRQRRALDDVAEAHRVGQTGHVSGTLVLVPR